MLTWKLQDSPLDYLFFWLVEHEFDLCSCDDEQESFDAQGGGKSRQSIIFEDFFSPCLGMQFMINQKPTEKDTKLYCWPDFYFYLRHAFCVCTFHVGIKNLSGNCKNKKFFQFINFSFFVLQSQPTRTFQHPLKNSSKLVSSYKNIYQFMNKEWFCPCNVCKKAIKR
jgi:hypothetical protein